MDDLNFQIEQILPWFTHEHEAPYVLVRVTADHANAWAQTLGIAVRRCYITDELLQSRAEALGVSREDILASKLPDAGSTMSGDFGEIIVYFYQSAKEHPNTTFGPKKWRLKQDRTKPAPLSDVVHFHLPQWPTATANDAILCSEVKTKSTDSNFNPIARAIEDCAKDRTSRLAKTLLWLRARAMGETLGDVEIAHLNRFINATDFPTAQKRFRAVAVVCANLLEGELPNAPQVISPDYTVVIISVPQLQQTYTAMFDAVRASATDEL